jgi:hypothetical protein
MHDDPTQSGRSWHKRASTAWIAFAAALAALAAVLGNLSSVLNFVDRFSVEPPLSLQLSDLRVEGDPSARAVTFTITKNIQAAGHNCYASLDTPTVYDFKEQRGPLEFELPRNVENDRRTFIFDTSSLSGSSVLVRIKCEGAVSNELQFPEDM